MKIEQKLFSEFLKPLMHVKHDCTMQLVKQQDNLRKFPNATSITSVVGLDKTLAVPVITLVLTASDFIWGFEKLPFPEHLGKYFIKIGKISAKIHKTGKIKGILDWE